jgi:hypothetical protein
MSKYTNPPKGGDLWYFANCLRHMLGLDPLPDVTDKRADPDRKVRR